MSLFYPSTKALLLVFFSSQLSENNVCLFLQDCCPGDVIRVTKCSVRRIRINSQRWVFITAIWSGKKVNLADTMPVEMSCPLCCVLLLTLLCSLSLRRSGRRRMFVTSTLYPVVTVTLTSVQWQWIKVTLTSYILRYVHTDTHRHTHIHTRQCKHTLYTNTYADMYTYTRLLCISLRLACPGSLSSSLTNELEAAPPSSPKSSFSSQLSLM